MITLENIPLPASPALAPDGHHSLSLHMARGEVLWVSGPAQSGKTALLEHLALLRRPASGHMTIMDYDAGPAISARTRRLLRQRISLIEAVPAFMEQLSLADNIALPLELAHFRRGDITRESEAIIRWFGLEDVAEARPAALSHTTRLRAACARALITQPSIILVDEPALTLCPALQEQLLATIRGLVHNGATALLAVQTPPAVAKAAERHITLPRAPAASPDIAPPSAATPATAPGAASPGLAPAAQPASSPVPPDTTPQPHAEASARADTTGPEPTLSRPVPAGPFPARPAPASENETRYETGDEGAHP